MTLPSWLRWSSGSPGKETPFFVQWSSGILVPDEDPLVDQSGQVFVDAVHEGLREAVQVTVPERVGDGALAGAGSTRWAVLVGSGIGLVFSVAFLMLSLLITDPNFRDAVSDAKWLGVSGIVVSGVTGLIAAVFPIFAHFFPNKLHDQSLKMSTDPPSRRKNGKETSFFIWWSSGILGIPDEDLPVNQSEQVFVDAVQEGLHGVRDGAPACVGCSRCAVLTVSVIGLVISVAILIPSLLITDPRFKDDVYKAKWAAASGIVVSTVSGLIAAFFPVFSYYFPQ